MRASMKLAAWRRIDGKIVGRSLMLVVVFEGKLLGAAGAKHRNSSRAATYSWRSK